MTLHPHSGARLSLPSHPDPHHLAALQLQWTEAWHDAPTPPSEAPLTLLVEREHRANFDLWHQEDQARDPAAEPAQIAAVKHTIDRFNQQRNDLIEEIDLALLDCLGPGNPTAPLHSETPGMILDRLSILALKLFHTRLETARTAASPDHHTRARSRVALLEEQRTDLIACLSALLAEVVAGTRRTRLYRQLKMYNDPDLNPVLYGRREAR